MAPTWHEYFAQAKELVLQECCKSPEEIETFRRFGEPLGVLMIPINTVGDANVVAQQEGFNTLLKSVFLQRPDFRQNVIGYYRTLGFRWCDIVCLNRDQFKIFLF